MLVSATSSVFVHRPRASVGWQIVCSICRAWGHLFVLLQMILIYLGRCSSILQWQWINNSGCIEAEHLLARLVSHQSRRETGTRGLLNTGFGRAPVVNWSLLVGSFVMDRTVLALISRLFRMGYCNCKCEAQSLVQWTSRCHFFSLVMFPCGCDEMFIMKCAIHGMS